MLALCARQPIVSVLGQGHATRSVIAACICMRPRRLYPLWEKRETRKRREREELGFWCLYMVFDVNLTALIYLRTSNNRDMLGQHSAYRAINHVVLVATLWAGLVAQV